MNRKHRAGPKQLLKRPRSADDRRRTVRRLTAQGYSGDIVAALVGLNKNRLRSTHALDLEAGREIARANAEAAENEKLSAKEEEMRRCFFAGFGTYWENEDGTNDLQQGRTLAECKQDWAEWLRRHRGGNDDAA
jgi:hypothetical protein